DPAKDQSYFMWGIESRMLPRMLLPVGHQTKAETRAVARRIGLNTADKVESQDICFVPDGDVTRAVPAVERRSDWRARGIRTVHDRAEARSPGRIPGADVRDRDQAGRE